MMGLLVLLEGPKSLGLNHPFCTGWLRHGAHTWTLDAEQEVDIGRGHHLTPAIAFSSFFTRLAVSPRQVLALDKK
jgi:hypothetical protein